MKIKELFLKSCYILRKDGMLALLKKFFHVIHFRWKVKRGKLMDKCFCDVLFINGCTLPHPHRYRVSHQIEQLKSNNFSAQEVFYQNLSMDYIKRYRCFIFFRCPITDTIERFIELAKKENKRVFFDIDDLVIDEKYTSQIKYLDSLSESELRLYNDGVNRMQKTLKLCDYAITSTERLADELRSYVGEVFINRNTVSEEMVKLSLKALKNKKALSNRKNDKVVLGYFSGSITHNDDFELILPSVLKIMEENPNVYLKIVGLLDVPEELKPFKDRILKYKFADWKRLPEIICSVDVNLVPLCNNIFNEAKSENKWIEASLCKTVTIASNIGAFKTCIENEVDGILCEDDEWFEKLGYLIKNEEYRNKVAENAFKKVKREKVTTYTGKPLVDFIERKLSKNICFVLPTVNTSGGVNVVLKHCEILKKHSWDVTIINQDIKENINASTYEINVISAMTTHIIAHIDVCVGTLWSTIYFVNNIPNAKNKKYLVQNFETDFYENGSALKQLANSTYSFDNVDYLTVSKWCKSWLEDKFDQRVKFVQNGLDLKLFPFRQRIFEGKIKILIEGNSKSYYKNVDESFKIIEKLDRDKFEIHYLSYDGEPKDWYHVDRFYNDVPYKRVGNIYNECDILIKSSILESFSYPPLEMMATGGICIVAPNDGNLEYLKNGYNCLLYNPGNIDQAVDLINSVVSDRMLRERIIKNGLETAEQRSWDNIEKNVIGLYE